jgi:hypothetical protein
MEDDMTVTSFPALFPGDYATSITTGTVYRVEKIKQIKAVCADVRGQLWDVRMPNLREATPEEAAEFERLSPKVETEKFRLGHVVRFKGAGASKYPGYFVVIKEKGDAEVSLVQAGGTLTSRYFPSVMVANLELIKEPVTIANV